MPIAGLRRSWERRTIVTRDPSAPRGPDGARVSWLFITGGFAAIATLLLFWVAMTAVRSVTETVESQAEREIGAARPAAATATAAPALARIGQRVESAGIELAVSSAAKTSMHVGSVAAPGRTFLIVDLRLESSRRPTTAYGPSGFRLRDADGGEHDSLIPSADDQRTLKGGVLAMGEAVRGTIAFDVPAGADGFVLAFQPDDLVADYRSIRIALGD
jgi:hypothetical protein